MRFYRKAKGKFNKIPSPRSNEEEKNPLGEKAVEKKAAGTPQDDQFQNHLNNLSSKVPYRLAAKQKQQQALPSQNETNTQPTSDSNNSNPSATKLTSSPSQQQQEQSENNQTKQQQQNQIQNEQNNQQQQQAPNQNAQSKQQQPNSSGSEETGNTQANTVHSNTQHPTISAATNNTEASGHAQPQQDQPIDSDAATEQNHSNQVKEQNNNPLRTSLVSNLQLFKQAVGQSDDIIIREIQIGVNGAQRVAVLHIDGLVDKNVIADFVVRPLLNTTELPYFHFVPFIQKQVLAVSDTKPVHDFMKLFEAVLSGDTVVLFDGYAEGLIVSSRGWKDRAVGEPGTESVVRGPRESFTESLRTNTALIRRKIKDARLRMESFSIGHVTHTAVTIAYLDEIVNEKLVDEARIRLNRINIDSILEGGYIEELIEDEVFTPFPTVFSSERPDVIAAELLEGKLAIIVDGTPFVLVAPALFVSFFHSAEDYYHRADISSFIRMLRYIAFFWTLLGPSLYVSVTTFHQEMLPTTLLINLTSQREGVPFPAFVEALIMELAFEIIREADIRMPRAVGSAVSIVGTLIIGQAAVEAGLVSAVMVIVVAITAISSFLFPSYEMSNAVRISRFPLMILAGTLGFFGLMVGLFIIVLHLCSLRTFGIPYFSPFAPLSVSGLKDTFLRFPRAFLKKRPALISQKNVVRSTTPTMNERRPKS